MSREFWRYFERFHGEVLAAPPATVLNKRYCRMALWVNQNKRLKRTDRQALAVEELSDAEICEISRAEPPAEAAQYDHEMTAGQGAES